MINWVRFTAILVTLVFYTTYKITQLWPSKRALALGLSLCVFVCMIGWQFLYRFKPAWVDQSWFVVLVWIGGLTMSVWVTFIIVSLPLDLIHLLQYFFQKTTAYDSSRRLFLSQGFWLGVFGLSSGGAVIGLAQTVTGPHIKKTTFLPKNLPEKLRGLSIAQISDLHVGLTIREGYVEEVVQQVNGLNPDLVFVTGDLADGPPNIIAKHLQPLANLKSKYGVYYVLGNHEYYWNAQDYMKKANELNFITLNNENRMLDIDGTKLMIAGVTDKIGGNFFPEHEPNGIKAAESHITPDFKILLAHRPDYCLEAEPLGFDLQFSGHTHGGQFFPFRFLTPLANKFYRGGLQPHGKLQLYINAGTGYWGAPNRFLIPSEISHIELS